MKWQAIAVIGLVLAYVAGFGLISIGVWKLLDWLDAGDRDA